MRSSRKRKLFKGAFIDQLAKVSQSSSKFKRPKDIDWKDSLITGFFSGESSPGLSIWRRISFLLIVLISFSVLLVKLFALQLVEGSEHRLQADENRIQIKVIHAPRGVIYDRNGKILAQNEPGFRLVEKVGDNSQKVTYLSRDEALNLEVQNDPRINNLEVDNLRFYPLGKEAAHIVGYIGEISEEELKSANLKNNERSSFSNERSSNAYKMGDKIGRSGIEEIYEQQLRGIDGGEVIEVDAEGRKLRTLRKTDPIPGQNIYLSIDQDLQTFVFRKLEEATQNSKSCCAALVAQNPNSGEILSLVSIPSFDPNKIEDSLSNTESPFLNRTIAGTYPPGSVFKIASSLAGLASGKITPQTSFEDTGVISLGPYKFANWYFTQHGRTEGSVNMVKALQRSNDIYFYRLGEIIGEKTLGDMAKKLGVGEKLGIDLPGETLGLIPDNAWKEENIGEVWFPGDTLHMAIGQGFVLSTPLQMNNLTAIVAANGNKYPPHLVIKITDAFGSLIKEFRYDPTKIPDLKEADLQIIKNGLEEVPKTGGTAWPFFNFPFKTAGKTGTAEYGSDGKTHAWYAGYAPVESPQIVMTVLIEGGGEGSTVASPVVKEAFRWFLSPDKSKLVPDIAPVASSSARILGE